MHAPDQDNGLHKLFSKDHVSTQEEKLLSLNRNFSALVGAAGLDGAPGSRSRPTPQSLGPKGETWCHFCLMWFPPSAKFL